jgi:hypothetical protein
MKDDLIPDNDNIARYCSFSRLSEKDGSIQATAFMLKQGEPSLSVNWLEFLNCPDRTSEIIEIRKVYLSTLSVGSQAKIAVLNVGTVRIKVVESPDHRKLYILHDPLDIDPSHSGIYNLRQNDESIAELIRETIFETYLAR